MSKKDKPIKKSKLIWIIAAIIYVISPIDLIPEIFPFLGQIDDIAVLIALVWQLVQTFGLADNIPLEKLKKSNKSKPKNKVSTKEEDFIDAEIIED